MTWPDGHHNITLILPPQEEHTSPTITDSTLALILIILFLFVIVHSVCIANLYHPTLFQKLFAAFESWRGLRQPGQ